MNKFLDVIVMFSIMFVLNGCGEKESAHVALSHYIKTVKQRPADNVEPLPAFETNVPFTYSSEHRRDPFRPVKRKITQGVSSDHRNKEVLEGFPLDSLHMVGTVKRSNKLWALMAADNGNVYCVTVDNHMGQDDGKIQAVTYEHVVLQEIVATEEGGWIKRNIIIPLGGDKSVATHEWLKE